MPRLKKRADGRYQKVIVDKRTGEKVYFYGKTEKEINQKVLAYNGKIENGKTFSEVANEWWENAQQELAYQSKPTYYSALKRALNEFDKKFIKSIKPNDISLFLYKLSSQGFAQRTISNHKIVCNKIFELAIIQNEIEFNPCASIKLPKNLQKAKRDPASIEEEESIKNVFSEWLVPQIALYSGLRKGEILALQWKDIDFKNNIIKVTKSIEYHNNIPHVKAPKTEAGIRDVPLLEPLKKILIDKKPEDSNQFIICNENGMPITKKAYEYRYNKAKKEMNIISTAHQIRHSFATNAVEADVDPKALQEIIGHRQISTTMDTYVKLRKKAFIKAAEKLNENFKK
ncbi:MAG: site-specific integrase [Clostridia bacterium]|nr:site-specific integrase [Clostridia bacterium]